MTMFCERRRVCATAFAIFIDEAARVLADAADGGPKTRASARSIVRYYEHYVRHTAGDRDGLPKWQITGIDSHQLVASLCISVQMEVVVVLRIQRQVLEREAKMAA